MDTRDDQQPAIRYSAGAPPQEAYQPSAPIPTSPTGPRFGTGALAAAIAGSLAAGVAVGYLAFHGGGKQTTGAAATPSASPSADTITMHGSLTLKHPAWVSATGTLGEDCTALDGYNDISAGTAVTIGDQTGATIVVTQLEQGQVTADGCAFNFDTQVPAGRTSYTVTVSHRGTQVFSPDQILQANMTLG